MRIARFAHASGMSFGVVEGESDAGPGALTAAEIDGHPFGQLRFTGQRWALAAGSLLQVAVIATGLVVPAMFVLGAVFAVLWAAAIWLGLRYREAS